MKRPHGKVRWPVFAKDNESRQFNQEKKTPKRSIKSLSALMWR
jgi:hypothetical protein